MTGVEGVEGVEGVDGVDVEGVVEVEVVVVVPPVVGDDVVLADVAPADVAADANGALDDPPPLPHPAATTPAKRTKRPVQARDAKLTATPGRERAHEE